MSRRVVITGLGIVSPMGVGSEAFWSVVLHGPSPLGIISRFDASDYPCQVGGEVRDLSYQELLPARLARNGTHVAQLAVAAAELARQDSTLADIDPNACGVVMGTAFGGWREGEQQFAILLERGARRVNPFVVNSVPHHASGAEIAELVGARGAQLAYSTGCSAGTQAILHSYLLVASGELDLCYAGGAESPLTPLVFAGMGRTLELARKFEFPHLASRPFDRQHNGIVLSEGGCVLVVEELEHARRRGARIYAELIGGRSACDALGLYNLDPDGAVGAAAIRRLLTQQGLDTRGLDWVCSHANSSPGFDRKEARVLQAAFGEYATELPVSSIKAVLGHPLGASGSFEAAAACLALRDQVIPPTHFLDDPDPLCDLAHVVGEPRATRVRRVLVTSYGYGGVNSYLLFGRVEEE